MKKVRRWLFGVFILLIPLGVAWLVISAAQPEKHPITLVITAMLAVPILLVFLLLGIMVKTKPPKN